jgi:hypothetical protein
MVVWDQGVIGLMFQEVMEVKIPVVAVVVGTIIIEAIEEAMVVQE